MPSEAEIQEKIVSELIPGVIEKNREELEADDDVGLVLEPAALEDVGPDTRLDAVLDSLLFVDLLLTIEDSFGVEFDEALMLSEVFETFGGLCGAVLRLLQGEPLVPQAQAYAAPVEADDAPQLPVSTAVTH